MRAAPAQLLNAYSWAYCHIWDWRHHVDTCGDIHPADLHSDPELQKYSATYTPTHVKLIYSLLDSLPLNDGEYRLVDFGSGKGRVILAALAYPFRDIEGIEVNLDLHATAEANLRNYRGPRRCQSARSVCIDARRYEIRPVETVYFFFSPFRGPIIQAVLENIFHSLRESPRDAFLLYVNPEEDQRIGDSGVFRRFSSGKYATVWRSSAGRP